MKNRCSLIITNYHVLQYLEKATGMVSITLVGKMEKNWKHQIKKHKSIFYSDHGFWFYKDTK